MMARILLVVAFSSFCSVPSQAMLPSLAEHLNKECEKSKFDPQICKLLIEQVGAVFEDGVGTDEAIKAFKQKAKEYVLTPDFLNERLLGSAAISSALKDKPLKLEFKAVEADVADKTVLGIAFDYKHTFKFEHTDEYSRKFDLQFKSEGFITQNEEENPRNLIEAQLSLSGSMHTDIKPTTVDIGEWRRNKAICAAGGDQKCKDEIFAEYDSVGAQYGGFYFLRYGLDAGIESDQSFDAKNYTVSGFVYGQYDFWDRNSFLGSLGVTVGGLLSIDQVSPSNETPRALAGDDSDYERIKGEITANIPLGAVGSFPVDLQFNYRTYREIAANQIVKDAGLDTYHLRSWALTGPQGMYVSYGSGALPFDLASEKTVELGVKWYLK